MKKNNLTKNIASYTGVSWQAAHGLFCPKHGIIGAPLIALGLLPAPALNKIDKAKHKAEHIVESALEKTLDVQTQIYLNTTEHLPNIHQLAEKTVELGSYAWFIGGASYIWRNQLKETKNFLEDKFNEYRNFPYLKK